MAHVKPKPRKPQTGVELSAEARQTLSWLKKIGFTKKSAIERGIALLKAQQSGRGI